MEKVRAIIVDDEEGARNVLSSLLTSNCPEIEIVDTCVDVLSAVESIKKHKPAVVFLDVQMPNYSGFEIVNFFDIINFEIIFITAYDSFAIRAFELNAVDYILKPIHRKRLIESVEKLLKKVESKQQISDYQELLNNITNQSVDKIVVAELGNKIPILLKNIIAVEAQGAYSCIHLQNGEKQLVSKNLKHFEELLPNSFFRAHKSWLIGTDKIEKYNASAAEITLTNSIVAKLSKYKKAEFEQTILA